MKFAINEIKMLYYKSILNFDGDVKQFSSIHIPFFVYGSEDEIDKTLTFIYYCDDYIKTKLFANHIMKNIYKFKVYKDTTNKHGYIIFTDFHIE